MGGEGGAWRNLRGEGGNADYGGMVQPSQQLVTPCVKEVEWGLIGDCERFEDSGCVLGQHSGRGYTGDRRSPTL